MRVSQMIVIVAAYTGWPLEYIGKLSYRRLLYMVKIFSHERQVEIYRLEYRIAQVMGILTSSREKKHRAEEFLEDPPEKMEVIVNMTGKQQPIPVMLGDGKEYNLPTLDANIMEAIEEEFNASWLELFEKPRAKTLKAIVFYLLRGEYPDLTREQVGALLTIKAQANVSKVIAKLI